jgi:TfoX/Sxy family transcriptional regulator of competence genes
MAQPYLDQLQTLLDKSELDAENIECKHFFSGAAMYCDSKICASLSPKGLAFKLGDRASAKLIDSGQAQPLRYFAKSPIKRGYVLFPDYAKMSQKKINGYIRKCLKEFGGQCT